MEQNNSYEIAATILRQLGGAKFRAMTGAKNFGYLNNSLTFTIPRHNGIKIIRITLDPNDTYTMEFLNTTGRKVITHSGIYFDQLQSLFSDATGLDTHL